MANAHIAPPDDRIPPMLSEPPEEPPAPPPARRRPVPPRPGRRRRLTPYQAALRYGLLALAAVVTIASFFYYRLWPWAFAGWVLAAVVVFTQGTAEEHRPAGDGGGASP